VAAWHDRATGGRVAGGAAAFRRGQVVWGGAATYSPVQPVTVVPTAVALRGS